MSKLNKGNILLPLVLLLLLLVGACSSVQYAAYEKLGIHKRDILVDRVEDARDSQKEAKEQFSSALEEFSAVLNFKGGELEETYDKLNAQLEQSEERAEEVRDRIEAVEDVAEALFDEWADELKQYSSDKLRRSSERKMQETRKHYQQLMKAMRRAESKIEPVLTPLRDQVLYLKHNLNAKAIASLQSELGRVEGNVSSLIKDMEAAIREADAFIGRMEE